MRAQTVRQSRSRRQELETFKGEKLRTIQKWERVKMLQCLFAENKLRCNVLHRVCACAGSSRCGSNSA